MTRLDEKIIHELYRCVSPGLDHLDWLGLGKKLSLVGCLDEVLCKEIIDNSMAGIGLVALSFQEQCVVVFTQITGILNDEY